ncbi:unnamed protein product [Sphenostylis stenocarpa]|uniref:Bifunctional inhibitor/plant lipid transfer protein/seed storage helical domain-containing protein n=1 Tax=Sphenostylis stenocarpa TaxID=92480 RepID=A0AA86SFD9_9FABA|nr:unnamed protein product [Sphenostylis stenocarpa]
MAMIPIIVLALSLVSASHMGEAEKLVPSPFAVCLPVFEYFPDCLEFLVGDPNFHWPPTRCCKNVVVLNKLARYATGPRIICWCIEVMVKGMTPPLIHLYIDGRQMKFNLKRHKKPKLQPFLLSFLPPFHIFPKFPSRFVFLPRHTLSMKKSGLLAASVAAASATAASLSSSSSHQDESRTRDNASSQSSSSSTEKFAPRFDGLRFIETLVTAHR